MPNNPNQQNQKPDEKARDQRPQTQEEKDRAAKARSQDQSRPNDKSGNY